MKKRKDKKTLFQFFRFLARTFVLNIPILLVLLTLLFLQKVNLPTAIVVFSIIFIITALITAHVFHELEQFISYLKNQAQGVETDLPRFHKGIFGSFRLADAFLSVKHMWSTQTISASRILENLPDPLIMVNENSHIVFANRMAISFFGEDLLHKPLKNHFSDSLFFNALNQISLGKTKQEWFEWDYQDDQIYTFQVRLEQLPAPAKNGATIVIVMHDITQLKLFKQQQADFFANASHELKTPLSIVSGFIETLQGPAKDDEIAREKFLKLMAEQTNRMTLLVQNLLNLSKLQMTQKERQHDIILIPEILKSVIDGLSIKAANANKTIKLKLLHDIPRLIGSKTELVQVFQNLIDNAIKYGAENSVITVKAQLCSGFPKKSDRYFSDIRQVVLISVHNEGTPISPKNITRLFERFYRIDSSKSKAVEGTGLGLGIAQQIVQKHDGVIDVQSSTTQGTVFSVYLPTDF